ncbi:hypothetical protein VTK26DRAFT_7615 [Humicola hyalothermophila]
MASCVPKGGCQTRFNRRRWKATPRGVIPALQVVKPRRESHHEWTEFPDVCLTSICSVPKRRSPTGQAFEVGLVRTSGSLVPKLVRRNLVSLSRDESRKLNKANAG